MRASSAGVRLADKNKSVSVLESSKRSSALRLDINEPWPLGNIMPKFVNAATSAGSYDACRSPLPCAASVPILRFFIQHISVLAATLDSRLYAKDPNPSACTWPPGAWKCTAHGAGLKCHDSSLNLFA